MDYKPSSTLGFALRLRMVKPLIGHSIAITYFYSYIYFLSLPQRYK